MKRSMIWILVVFIIILVTGGVVWADDIIGSVGKTAAKGVKTAIVDVPNKVGGGVSYGFDIMGRFLDDIGEKEKTSKPKGKPDPMTSQRYPGTRQF